MLAVPMAVVESHYILQVPHTNSPEVDEALLRKVAFLRKLGPECMHFRNFARELHVFIRAPHSLQQMRQAVSGKINTAQGFSARVRRVDTAEEFAQLLSVSGFWRNNQTHQMSNPPKILGVRWEESSGWVHCYSLIREFANFENSLLSCGTSQCMISVP